VTEYDDHLFCLLTMNHHPLHLDANYAGRPPISPERVVATTSTRCCSHVVPDVSARPSRTWSRVAAARGADLPRRHHLRRDDRARKRLTSAVTGHRPGRDPRLQPARRRVCVFRRKVMVPTIPTSRNAREQPGRPSPTRRPADFQGAFHGTPRTDRSLTEFEQDILATVRTSSTGRSSRWRRARAPGQYPARSWRG